MNWEKNRFYQNRKEIRALCQREEITIDMGSTLYAHQQGWTGWQEEMDEWKALQRKLLAKGKLAEIWK